MKPDQAGAGGLNTGARFLGSHISAPSIAAEAHGSRLLKTLLSEGHWPQQITAGWACEEEGYMEEESITWYEVAALSASGMPRLHLQPTLSGNYPHSSS